MKERLARTLRASSWRARVAYFLFTFPGSGSCKAAEAGREFPHVSAVLRRLGPGGETGSFAQQMDVFQEEGEGEGEEVGRGFLRRDAAQPRQYAAAFKKKEGAAAGRPP